MSWWARALDALGARGRRGDGLASGSRCRWLSVDAGQIERALVNLLENAIKFSAPEARVSVSVDAEGGEVVVAVRDEGVGLPPEDLLTVFEPFQRGSGSAERPGAGLGLAIVRGFAQANGGRAWAESDGRGATFFLALPMAEAAVEISDVSSGAHSCRRRRAADPARAQDEPGGGRVRGRDGGDSGGGARLTAASDPPDALILDLVLPDRQRNRGDARAPHVEFRADRPPLGCRRRAREGRCARRRCRRLRDEALRDGGAARTPAGLAAASGPSSGPVIELGMLTLDLDKKALFVSGELVSLTPHEFDLLRLLATNEGKLLTHRAILREVWGPAYGDGVALPARLRLAASPEDRARPGSTALSPDGAGRRLQARESRRANLELL